MILLPLLRILKRCIALIDLVIFTLVMYSLTFLPKRYLGFYPKLFRHWCKCFIDALGVTLYVHQKYKTKLPEKYIVISNHPSALEDLGMSAVFDVRFLAKIEMKDWFILGRISVACGSVYVKRDDKRSRVESLRALSDLLEQGTSVGLYPEGGCFDRRLTLPFHTGMFNIAIKTNTPIVPVFLHHEAQENFEWKDQTLVKKLWEMATVRNPRVNYYIFEPILPSDFANKEALVNYVQERYLSWQKQYLE